MKNLRYFFVLMLFSAFVLQSSAQTRDSRHRVASTIIADGLAQLPAQNNASYNQVIGEMASTGAEGMQMLVGMLKPSGQGQNAAFTYAIDGIAAYVMTPGHESLRNSVHSGLVKGLSTVTDKDNTAFLLGVLQQFADKEDFQLFRGYLSDSYLRPYALRALAVLPGVDEEVVGLMQQKAAPIADLANLVYWRRMPASEVEDILQGWVKGASDNDLHAIYNALAACGSVKSLKLLAAAARQSGYKDDVADANDAYLMLLDRLSATDSKDVAKAARQLLKLKDSAMRCAGMKLLLQIPGTDVTKEVLASLKDGDVQLRNTALLLATPLVESDALAAQLMSKYSSLSSGAKIDVLRWLGNNHKQQASQLVAEAVGSSDEAVALAAIHSAGQIGGDVLLQTLLKSLSGPHADKAQAALEAFRGNIGNALATLIHSSMPNVPVKALELAGQRHVSAAYADAVKLLSSGDSEQKKAAAKALATLTTPAEFSKACDLMEQSQSSLTPKLQESAMFAIHTLSADEQYSRINSRLSSTQHPALYYPLLAQVGSIQAIERLQKEYAGGADKEAAYRSLLKVDSPSMLDVLYSIAKNEPQQRETALSRYVQLVSHSKANSIQRYQLVRRALDLNPSAGVSKKLVAALASSYTLPALTIAGRYLDNKELAPTAAEAVRTILTKERSLLGGQMVKALLAKAAAVYTELAKSDADAGYALKDINGLSGELKATGFAKSAAEGTAEGKKAVSDGKQYENFELFFDYKTEGNGLLSLRSMAEVRLDGSKGASFLYNALPANPAKSGSEWNTVYVKLVNDRILVESNGQVVAENAVIKNGDVGKALNARGVISILSRQGAVEVRDVYVNELPSTPVYTVSKAEQKEGFVSLFDGRSLSQWQGNLDNYVPEDGNIYVKAHYGNGGNLYTKKKYSDFIYRFEFCFVKPGVNNGIGIRTKLNTDAAYEGMEIQVLDHDDPIYAGLHPYQQHGAVYGIIVPKHVKFGKLGTWNTEEIQAIGDHIKVTVNGEVILDGNIREACQGHNVAPDGSSNNPYTVDHNNHPGLFNKDGFISFCGHGEGVKFRNIRIKDLSRKK